MEGSSLWIGITIDNIAIRTTSVTSACATPCYTSSLDGPGSFSGNGGRGALRRHTDTAGSGAAGQRPQHVQRGRLLPYGGCGEPRKAVSVRDHGAAAQEG